MAKQVIVVTGATGSIGRSAVDYLLRQCDSTRIRAVGRQGVILQELARQGIETYMADLNDMPDAFLGRALSNVKAVWHCAGLCSPFASKEAYRRDNVDMPLRLFKAAAKRGAERFIFVSSPSIYFDYTDRRDIREDFRAAAPASGYAESKLLAEQLLREASTQFPATKLIILRPRPVYGPYDRNLLPALRNLVNDQRTLKLPKGGNVFIDMCYSGNLAHAMWQATQADVPSGSAFNITDDRPVYIKGLVEMFFQGMGEPVTIQKAMSYPLLKRVVAMDEFFAKKFKRTPKITQHMLGSIAFDMTLDISAAKAQLNYRPVYSLAYAINETIEWIQGIRPL